MIFGGGTQHGGSADIDILYGVGKRAVRLGNGLTKRVEVDDQQIDAIDLMFFEGRHVRITIASREQSAMNLRMQRFNATVEDFWGASVFGNLGDLETSLRE
jgi:hypothetical protein